MTAGYAVAVLSYQRPAGCAEKTLTTLTGRGVSPADITVFVADDDAARDYKTTCGALAGNIVVGVPGLAPQRNFISRWYPAGQQLVCCDDDIEDVRELGPDGKLASMADLDGFFRGAFAQAARHGATLWGTYPVANGFFMKRRVALGLRFCIGVIHGVINDPGETLTRHCKDDYERTLLRWEKDGTVARHDYVAAVTRYAGNSGGLQSSGGRTPATAEADVAALIEHWPGVVTRNTRRKSPFPEILLKAPRGQARREERLESL